MSRAKSLPFKDWNPDSTLRFLLVRTDNIGDVLLSVPVAKVIKAYYPKAHITLLCKSLTQIIGERNPYVDQTLTIDDKSGNHHSFTEMLKRIKEMRFDCSISLHPDLSMTAKLWLGGIPVRVGTGYRFYSLLFNKRHFEHRKESKKHEAEYNIGLLNAIDIPVGTPEFDFIIEAHELAESCDIIKTLGVSENQKFCVIHPGSRGSAMDWALESYAETAKLMVNKFDILPIITWGQGEEHLAERVVNLAEGKVRMLEKVYSLPILAGILKKAEFVVAPSTGVLHLANTVKTNVIGLYPPVIHESPVRWGPYGKPDSTLVPEIRECDRCPDGVCKKIDCMKQISPEMVVEKIESLLMAENKN